MREILVVTSFTHQPTAGGMEDDRKRRQAAALSQLPTPLLLKPPHLLSKTWPPSHLWSSPISLQLCLSALQFSIHPFLFIMSSEMVMVDGVPFPPEISADKPLALLGHGITDIEIHFLQIKYNAIGIYMPKNIIEHLGIWKGKLGAELAEDDLFFEALVAAPVDKFFTVVVIKEIKGSQYGVQLESAVRDRLAAIHKYEEEEEEALEKVSAFFRSKYFKKDSVITLNFPASPRTVEISFATEGKEETKIKVENANVVEMIQKWFLGGNRAVSPTTVKSLADNLGAMLLQ